jgi:beta-phosphoglucomutase-like phosphatase (HAD superfamily)
MVRAVIFDMDGTLVDSVDLHAKAWQDAFRDFGHEFELKAIRNQIGKGGDQLLLVFLTRQEIVEKGPDLEKHRGDILKERYLSKIKPFPKVIELFERIRADKIKIVLASSAKAEELQTYKKIAGIDGLIDAETSSDDATKSKPAPDIFQAALAKLKGVHKSEVVAVGDTPTMLRPPARPASARSVSAAAGLRKQGCAMPVALQFIMARPTCSRSTMRLCSRLTAPPGRADDRGCAQRRGGR